jgi:hypothetical protein
MKIDLTAEELEALILALKEQVGRRKQSGDPSHKTEALIARLEQDQRDQRRQKPKA